MQTIILIYVMIGFGYTLARFDKNFIDFVKGFQDPVMDLIMFTVTMIIFFIFVWPYHLYHQFQPNRNDN